MSNEFFEQYMPGISLDCVVFGFHESELRVLLLKLKNMDRWALPGGFLPKNMDVNEAAVQVLKGRTGLEDVFLRQFQLFGDPMRHNQSYIDQLVEKKVLPVDVKPWFEQRFITAGYYALVEYSKVREPSPDQITEVCEWKSIDELPSLVMDHHEIIRKAYEVLQQGLMNDPVGLNLMPEKFTMPELQRLYETILGRELDRRNFRRKILSFDILEETREKRTGGRHKAPVLYRFDIVKYKKALTEGLTKGWS